jgi:hypothetical protein
MSRFELLGCFWIASGDARQDLLRQPLDFPGERVCLLFQLVTSLVEQPGSQWRLSLNGFSDSRAVPGSKCGVSDTHGAQISELL